MSLAKTLWEANADLARAILEHPFVCGIGDGTLPLASFQEYVVQDAVYLESFARAYALALAHSPDAEGVREFAGLVAGVIEELELHAGYAEKWGVDPTKAQPADATLAYTDSLLATAALGSVGQTCAAMTPCMRLYAYLGQSLAVEGHDEENPYDEWIQTYSTSEFDALAAKLETLLDRYATDTDGVRDAYRRAMRLEQSFFEAAWRKA